MVNESNWEAIFANLCNMKVIANKCVSEIHIPEGIRKGNGIEYNPVLDFYVTMSLEDGISVWNPVSGKVVAECDLGFDGFLDMLLLPGNRIGVSYSELHHCGSVSIYSLEKDTFVKPELDVEIPSLSYTGVVYLSPQKSLLVAGAPEVDCGLFEVCIDWDNLKVLKIRELHIRSGYDFVSLFCSSDFVFVSLVAEENDFCGLNLRLFNCKLNSEQAIPEAIQGSEEPDEDKNVLEKTESQEEVIISYYILDGEEVKIDSCYGFVHDGENLIIANGGKIVLLESLKEGSNAHLVASECFWCGFIEGMNLNHKGQLIVQGSQTIKLFEYKCSPRLLQDLCRCCILETIPTCCSEKVNQLPIPSNLKDYLLYK